MARMKTHPLGRRVMALFLATIMCVSLVQISAFAVEPSPYAENVAHQGEIQYFDANGAKVSEDGDWAVKMQKTAEATNVENQFNMKLSVDVAPGKIINTTQTTGADIVMVLDLSGSMDDALHGSTTTKWDSMKTAANSFIEKMLGSGNPNHNRIAIAGYSNNEKTICDFTDDITILKNSYDFDSAWDTRDEYEIEGSATNCQGGFRAADSLLDSSRGDAAKYVVYMSDGRTNLYYKANSRHDDSAVMTGGRVSSQTKDGAEVPTKAAQDQAAYLKNNHPGTKIITVGLGTDSNRVLDPNHTTTKYHNGYWNCNIWHFHAEWKGCEWVPAYEETVADGNTAVNEFHVATTANIELMYNTIAHQILLETNPWTVYDPMSDYVDLVADSFTGDTQANGANAVTTDMDGRRIVWDLRTVASNDSTKKHFELNYTVTLKPDTARWEKNADGEQPQHTTNGVTSLVYKINETNDGTTVSHDAVTTNFDVPEVKASVYTVTLKYYVDGVEQTNAQETVKGLGGTAVDLTSATYQKELGGQYTSFEKRTQDTPDGAAAAANITLGTDTDGKVICFNYASAYPLTIQYLDQDTENPVHDDYSASIPAATGTYSVKSPEVAGYHLASAESATVAGSIDGAKTIRVYYVKNYYKLQYSFTNSAPEGKTVPVDSKTYRFGDAVTIAGSPSDEHYAFSGWNLENFSISTKTSYTSGTGTAADPYIIPVTGSWKANQYHLDMIYQFNEAGKLTAFLDGRKAAGDAAVAMLGDEADAAAKAAARETAEKKYVDAWNLGTFESSYCAANGQTYENVFVKEAQQTKDYNSEYDFTSSKVGVSNYQVTLAESSAALKGKLTKDSTVICLLSNDLFQITINHYTKNRAGEYVLNGTADIFSKHSGDSYTVASREIAGYTFDAADKEKLGAKTVSGETTINLHYSAIPYQAEFHFLNAAPKNVEVPVAQTDLWYGEKVKDPATTAPNGWVFSGWQTRTGNGTEKSPYVYTPYNFDAAVSGDVDLYGTWEQLHYNVKFNFTGDVPEAADTPAELSLTYGDKATQPTVTAADYNTDAVKYSFDGWYTSSAKFDDSTKYDFTTGVTNDVQLYGNWTKKTQSYTYTVEHWNLDTNQKFEVTKKVTPEKLPYGTVIDATAAATYQLGNDAIANQFGNGAGEFVRAEGCTIGADVTKNVIKCYYQAKSFQLTVNYLYQDQTPAAEPVTKTVKAGSSYSVASPAVQYYHVDSLQKNEYGATLSGGTVTGTMPASNATLTVIYAQDPTYSVVIHYLDKETNKKVAADTKIEPLHSGDSIGDLTDMTSGKTVDGYSYDSMSKIPVTIASSNVEVNVYFTHDVYHFVEKHIDSKTNKEFSNTQRTATLNIGTDYATAPLAKEKLPADYKQMGAPVVSGKAEKDGTVTVTYTYGPKADASVTIQYIQVTPADEKGKWTEVQTIDSATKGYKESDDYDLSGDVTTWNAAHTQYTQVKSDSLTGTLNGAESKTLKVYYTLNDYAFAVKYYNDNTSTEIAPTDGMKITAKVPFGMKLDQKNVSYALNSEGWTTALMPAGYNISKITYATVGTDAEKNIVEVHYVYTAPNIPTPPVPPVTPNIADVTPPTTDIPTTETPTTETPTTTIPEVETPTTEKPATKPTAEIPDEKTPLAKSPKTGDALALWVSAAVVSGAGLAWLAISAKKRKNDSAQ